MEEVNVDALKIMGYFAVFQGEFLRSKINGRETDYRAFNFFEPGEDIFATQNSPNIKLSGENLNLEQICNNMSEKLKGLSKQTSNAEIASEQASWALIEKLCQVDKLRFKRKDKTCISECPQTLVDEITL